MRRSMFLLMLLAAVTVPILGNGAITTESLPESASALPLIAAVAAGAVLGGLISARRTARKD